MIITVTLNAAIDKSLAVPNFRLGRRHRTVDQRTAAGGKGVNIARTLKALGQPVIATGFAGGATGTHIVEQLTEESILNDFVRIREESRTNTSVLDPTTGEQTEINERGPSVSTREVELFRDKLLYLARGAAIVVFAGSLPRGVEPDIYASLIRDLERLDVLTVVDADGEPLRQAVRAEPDVVSPNVLEAEELVGHEFSGEEERSLAVTEITALGPREAIMTLPDGCFAQVHRRRPAPAQARDHRAARAGRQERLRRRLPGRLPGGALRRPRARPVPALWRGLRSGVHARLGAGLIDSREARRLMGDVELTVIDLPAEVSRAAAQLAAGDVATQEHQVAGEQRRHCVQRAHPGGMGDRSPVGGRAQEAVPVPGTVRSAGRAGGLPGRGSGPRSAQDQREHDRADDRGGAVAGHGRQQQADASDRQQRDQVARLAANTSSSALGRQTVPESVMMRVEAPRGDARRSWRPSPRGTPPATA